MGRKFDRAYGVLQADKTVMSEACKELVEQDLEKSLAAYFELMGTPVLTVVKERGEYFATIEFRAERIKHFQVLK